MYKENDPKVNDSAMAFLQRCLTTNALSDMYRALFIELVNGDVVCAAFSLALRGVADD